VWPNLVVVAAPSFDHRDGLGAAAEVLHIETFVTKAAIEALVRAVLPRLAGCDVRRFDALVSCSDPGQINVLSLCFSYLSASTAGATSQGLHLVEQ
jgi:hypothetical protein